MSRSAFVALLVVTLGVPLWAQRVANQSLATQPALQITSRAVLVDAIVTGKHGKPVMSLKRDEFTVTHQGKPQAITFFEENGTRPGSARGDSREWEPARRLRPVTAWSTSVKCGESATMREA